MPRGDRTQKLQPRSMDAKINRFETRMRHEPDFRYQSHSPAGNVYDGRNFTMMDSVGHGYQKHRGADTVADSFFENSFLSNPNTGQKFGHSVASGPSWSENRLIYPDASGFGSRRGDGEVEFYDIQLKGPQTWGYDPAIEEQGSRLEIYDPNSVGTQIKPYNYNYNQGGIAGLLGPAGGPPQRHSFNGGGIAGQWSPSTILGDEETFDIKTLGLDPGIMSIDDLEDLFEEAGLDKRIIYNLINTGGLSQLVS